MRILLCCLMLCGCSSSFQPNLRIGMDPTWGSTDFGPQTSYVNGYTEDVLLTVARYSGMEFELIRANWDDLADGLRQGKYDAVVTTLPRYEHHLAKYDFSEDFLKLGPVLLVPIHSQKKGLQELEGDLVGIISEDPAALILEKYPTIVIRTYSSIPDLLNALAQGDIEGGLLPNIPAMNYVADLYAGVLQVAGEPLTDAGIHLIGPKGSMWKFNKYLNALRKKQTLQKLQSKWEL